MSLTPVYTRNAQCSAIFWVIRVPGPHSFDSCRIAECSQATVIVIINCSILQAPGAASEGVQAVAPLSGDCVCSDIQVLQELLDMLRDHQNNFHTARLEWIVIWLIVVEVVVGLFECASILGWVGHA